MAYWIFEICLVALIAGMITRQHKLGTYCASCKAQRKYKVLAIGTVDNLELVIKAFQRAAYQEGITLLEEHETGAFSRLALEYCPRCTADSWAQLEFVEAHKEQIVWHANLTAEEVETLLALER